MAEPIITLNGRLLTQGESMTIRVALQSLYMTLEDGLGDDEHGKAMTEGYRACIRNINQIIMGGPSR